MCHGSSLLEEFFAGKAFQEVKEKASSTDAKSMEKRTEGLHQAQYSVKFKVWLSSWYRTTRDYVFPWVSFSGISFVYLMLLLSRLLCLLLESFCCRSWQKFRSKWVPSMLS